MHDVCAHYYVPFNKAPSCPIYPLTDLGKSRIVGGGKTKYILKMHYDEEEISPTKPADHYYIGCYEPACLPILRIKYCPPC
jgi:hypothetical protein